MSKHKKKLIVAGLTAGVILAASRPTILSKVEAATNIYDWTKQEDLDLLGGRYSSAAMSASGSHMLLSTVDGGENTDQESPLFVSQDSGVTWENIADDIDPGIRHWWTSVDVSNDGQTMVAASEWALDIGNSGIDGKIFVSTDGGNNWTDTTPENGDDWQDAVISGDGSKLIASQWGFSNIVVSENNGDSWTTVETGDLWNIESISVSDDGEKILLGGENGIEQYTTLHLSENGGDSWTNISPDYENEIFSVSHDMSANGDKIIASTIGWVDGGTSSVFVSENSGTDWTEVTPGPEGVIEWIDTNISDDGSVVSALDENGLMFVSNDLGSNWSEEDPGQEYEDSNSWESLDSNADGSRLIVAGQNNAYVVQGPSSSVTLNDAEGGKTIIITTPEGTTITCSSAVKESGLTAQDRAYRYPLGLVDFCFSGAEASNEISILFVTDLKPDEIAVRKYNPDNESYTTITESNVSQTTYEGNPALLVTYAITDNGPLDTDPDVGEVADPVGLGVQELEAPDTGKQQHWLLSVKQ